MRFLIEYKDFKSKEEEHQSLRILGTFLNEHFIADFHGHTFDCILIRFINNAPPKKKFKLKSLYKTIAEVEIAGEFIENRKLYFEDFQQALEKVDEAINMVPQIEVKEELDFDKEKLLKRYEEMIEHAPQTDKEFRQYAKKEKEVNHSNRARWADYLMHLDKRNLRPLEKQLVGVRLYDDYLEDDAVSPYDYVYCQLFSNLLRQANVKLPGYEEIYFSIGETIEDAKQSIMLDEFFKYTYSTINIAEYERAGDNEKAKMVFESMCEGLRLIADFDHLEKDKIEEVIEYIDKNGMDIELTYCTRESKHYRVEVVYRVPQDYRTMAEFNLRVTNLHTNTTRMILIDKLHINDAPYIIGKVQVKKHEIIITGRTSVTAECTRKMYKLPSEYRFIYEEIFNIEAEKRPTN
jgi:hypothetical protein